ncbi:2163_t:CDS:2 [Ambispora leptoticha]|uniref:2163_t:CDS:1 n=1 Tax=Ambispora leptoticha TaxID=144679 RepID=A0A9N8YLB0_9GLOM|nr:2163_t:CDS:2 [Ambispora leptoticha]
MNKLNHEGLLVLEQPFIKVPLEQLKKSARTSQRQLDKEFSNLSRGINDLAVKSKQEEIRTKDVTDALEEMVGRLQKLKRKLNDIKEEESMYVSRSRIRLEHLNELTKIPTANVEAYAQWSRTRLDRILVDYMLREGLSRTAEKLAKEDINPKQYVDVELFSQSKRVEQALQKHSCSTLEFNLRLQEYIELVRSRRTSEAIVYSRKYLTPWSETHMKEIQQALGLLAFPSNTNCQPYKKLYDTSRWEQLIRQFRSDNFALNSLTSQPLLSVTLQAGLSALKTPMCYQPENRNINCPVCSADTLGNLAENLPLSHHVNSTIVCRLSGEIMDEDNAPMALPNGYVYSHKALSDMAAKNNGKVQCPRTGDVFDVSQLKKVFIS